MVVDHFSLSVPAHSHIPSSPSPPAQLPVVREKPTSCVPSSSEGRPGRLVVRLPNNGRKKPSSAAATSSSSSDQEKHEQNKEKSEAIKGERKKKRTSFSLELTREEIEKDVVEITGRKPTNRPMKRSKKAQNDMDKTFPGVSSVSIFK